MNTEELMENNEYLDDISVVEEVDVNGNNCLVIRFKGQLIDTILLDEEDCIIVNRNQEDYLGEKQ